MASPNYRFVLNAGIERAQAKGYRIVDNNLFDYYKRVCCPIGATMAFNPGKLSNDFMRSFIRGFDGQSNIFSNPESYVAYDLGCEYRGKYVKKDSH